MDKSTAHQADFESIALISDNIINAIQEESLGDSLMGLALTLSRLITSQEDDMEPEAEAQFVAELIDWASLRLTKTNGGIN